MYLGLTRETALSCFDFSLYGENVLKMGVKEPVLIHQAPGLEVHKLIGSEDTPCFSMTRYTCTGGAAPLDIPASVYIVTDGSGTLEAADYCRELQAGNYFFLPYEAKGYTIKGNIRFVCCAGGQ